MTPTMVTDGEHTSANNLANNLFVLNWLEHDPAPRLILDHDLTIRWCNRAAQSFLESDPDIGLAGSALHIGSKAKGEQFSHFIASVVVSGSLYMAWEERDDFLLVRAERLPDTGNGQAFAVTMNSRQWAESSIRFEDLEIAFGLTSREVEIVTRLAQGQSVTDIGPQIDCAVETVRRHVKNIYLKVGVSTREALLNRLSSFRS